MKLGLLYTFWTGDDIEMLIKSINYHKKHVDKIIVCYQDLSNKGETSSSEVLNNRQLMDVILTKYTPDLRINTKANELRKHNEMLNVAKDLGCTHFILSAADHFYGPELIQKGKEIISSGSFDLIVTKMITYYKSPEWVVSPIEDYYMPFIHELKMNTQFVKNVNYPVLVDPAVKVNSGQRIYVMPKEQGLMHHFSMIRKDIKKKFRNAAASIRWSKEQITMFEKEYESAKLGDTINYFQGRKIVLWSEMTKTNPLLSM